MTRVLLILRGPIEVTTLRARCAAVKNGTPEPFEMALCHVLATGQDGLMAGVEAQRALTAALRHTLGNAAEAVAVFVASDREGQRVEDCAREWGATVVVP